MRPQLIPRLQNEETDALTNGDFTKFNSGRRILIDLQKLPFGVLPELVDQGDAYVKELEDLKSATKRAGAQNAMAGFSCKRKAEDALEVEKPW